MPGSRNSASAEPKRFPPNEGGPLAGLTDIGPFADFLAGLVREGLEGSPVAGLPC